MAKKDFSQLVAHLEQKQEVKEEVTNFDEQMRTLRLAVTHIINNTLTLEHEGKNIEELVKALNAAKESIDNAITGICNAIVKAHQTPMKVEMTDESKQTMKEGQTKMLNREAELFKNHEEAIGKSIQTWNPSSRRSLMTSRVSGLTRKPSTSTIGRSSECWR